MELYGNILTFVSSFHVSVKMVDIVAFAMFHDIIKLCLPKNCDLRSISAWMSNYMHSKVCDEIDYPF